jgi:hypothetical protein
LKDFKNIVIASFLTIILCLVFVINEKEIGFSNIIDLKTVLGVIGTLGGAYLGASIAGKKSLEAVERQIDNDNKKQKEEDYSNQIARQNIIIILYGECNFLFETIAKRIEDESKENQKFSKELIIDAIHCKNALLMANKELNNISIFSLSLGLEQQFYSLRKIANELEYQPVLDIIIKNEKDFSSLLESYYLSDFNHKVRNFGSSLKVLERSFTNLVREFNEIIKEN